MKLGNFELNTTHCLDNVSGLRQLPDACIDLTVTSPPYDNLRTYEGFTWDFESLAQELYRVTKPGCVVVWVVGDATINGSETGTSFRQALYFKDVCGFNLHDTMIYKFAGTGAKGSNLAYWQGFEYMFIFSKGTPGKVNKIADHKNVKHGAKNGHIGKYSNGTRKERGIRITPEFSVRDNVWYYGGTVGDKTFHTAQFPEALARDHILSWSNPGDIVLDPFSGSGTTGKMAKQNGRLFIGFEISQKYTDLANKRMAAAQPPLFVDTPPAPVAHAEQAALFG